MTAEDDRSAVAGSSHAEGPSGHPHTPDVLTSPGVTGLGTGSDKPGTRVSIAARISTIPPASVRAAELITASAALVASTEHAVATDGDDLTCIDDIDAALAAALAAQGVRRFSDIAGWLAADVARIRSVLNLGRRISKENWIEQAALLAAEQPVERLAAAPEAPTSAPVSREEPSIAMDPDTIDVILDSPPAAAEAPEASIEALPEPGVEAQDANVPPPPVRTVADLNIPEARVMIVEGTSRVSRFVRSRFASASTAAEPPAAVPRRRRGFDAASHAAYRSAIEEASVEIVHADSEQASIGRSARAPRSRFGKMLEGK